MDEMIWVRVGDVVYSADLKKARKPHICRICGRIIEKGEHYYRYMIFARCCLCVECAEKNKTSKPQFELNVIEY